MPESALTDKAKKPSAAQVTGVLDGLGETWDGFLSYLRTDHAPLDEEWKFGKTGWHLVTKRKKRTVCYLFPEAGQFTVAFVFGEKAVEAARQSKLPKAILESIETARPYVEGRGFYVVCKKPADMKHLLTLTAIKMAN